MADEPQITSPVPEAVTPSPEAVTPVSTEGTAPPEPSYTAAQLRAMSLEDLARIHPEINSHVDSRAEAIYQRELERTLAEYRPQVEEEVQQRNEDAYLRNLRQRNPQGFATEHARIEAERAQRMQTLSAQQYGVQAASEQSMAGALSIAEAVAVRLKTLSPADHKELVGRTYARSPEGVLQFVQDAQDKIALRTAEQRLAEQTGLIEQTARKSALGDMAGESPDVAVATGAPARENRDWFSTQPLAERQRIRRQEPARYDAIMAAGARR